MWSSASSRLVRKAHHAWMLTNLPRCRHSLPAAAPCWSGTRRCACFTGSWLCWSRAPGRAHPGGRRGALQCKRRAAATKWYPLRSLNQPPELQPNAYFVDRLHALRLGSCIWTLPGRARTRIRIDETSTRPVDIELEGVKYTGLTV